MIRKIGVICEDARSRGFLIGLRDRLDCRAELVESPFPSPTHLTRKTAKKQADSLQKCGVDLLVRFVDADGRRWQDVEREERSLFPDTYREMLVCGVAVENVENWLALDAEYLASSLHLDPNESQGTALVTGRVKKAIAVQAHDPVAKSEVVARVVRECPDPVFANWLKKDKALRAFYDACRQAANRASCETPNELDPDQ